MAGAKSGTQHPVVRLCEFILEVLGCVGCEEVLLVLVWWCHRSSPGGLQEPALPLALGLASAQSGNRRSPPPPSMATWIPLPSALPGSTVRCIPAPPPGAPHTPTRCCPPALPRRHGAAGKFTDGQTWGVCLGDPPPPSSAVGSLGVIVWSPP